MKKSYVIAKNRQAFFDYDILDKIECGIVLVGKEIKAIRAGKVDLTGSYAKLLGKDKLELFWLGGRVNVGDGSDRTKKLLVSKSEIKTLIGKAQIKGLTLIPLEIYLKRGRAKLMIGIAKGRHKHDKREAIKNRDIEKENRKEYNRIDN